MQTPRFSVILLIVIFLAAVGQITNTIYVPAMNLIATSLHTNPEYMQSIMAMFLIPYGVSQFLYGPLSDHFGRRPIILLGLMIYIIGSLIATFSTTFDSLLLASFIQGTGIGVAGVMSRTLMRDLYSGAKLHRAASMISIALVFAPLAAPLVGGLLSTFWGWRADFLFLLVFSVLVFALQYHLLPETNPAFTGGKKPKQNVWRNYGILLHSPQFIGYMVCLLVSFAGVSVFEASGGLLS